MTRLFPGGGAANGLPHDHAPYLLRQLPEVWLAALILLTVLSSAYAMWAQPFGSRVSEMKSSRLRFELGARQKMPRLQMSPTCIGVVVIWVTVQLAALGLRFRFSDCPPKRFQLHAGG